MSNKDDETTEENKHEEILEFIEYMNTNIGERPQCFLFALFLTCKFKGGLLLYNSNHFITLINGKCYDWDGLAERTSAFMNFPEGWGDNHIVNHYGAIKQRFNLNNNH